LRQTPSDPRRLRRDIIDALRRLREIAHRCDDTALVGQLDESLDHIENQRFTIAVAGEFKRGKSTFVNALLGADILPSDVAPASATLTRVTYGPPAARIIYRAPEGQPPPEQTIAIEQLRDFITKLTPEARAIAETVQEAIVSYPSPFCRIHQIDLLDTPGLGDEAAMTEVTAAALQRVDGVIMMVLADSPFGESEGEFLERLLALGFSRMLFVVTALDRIEPEDRPAVLNFVAQRVRERMECYAAQAIGDSNAGQPFRFGDPLVFGISGRQALRARQSNNAALEAESGFKEFLEALDRFLTHESEGLALRRRIVQIRSAATLLAGQLDARITMLHAGRSGNDAIAPALLDALLHLCDRELQRIANAHDQARAIISRHLGHLATSLKARITEEINAIRCTGEELESQYAVFVGRLTVQIEAASREVIGVALTQIGAEVGDLLAPVTQELHPFAVTVGYVLTFTRRCSGDAETDLRLPDRLTRLRDRPSGADIEQIVLDGNLLRFGQTVPCPWIGNILQSRPVRECLAIPANENSINRALRRQMLPVRFRQALTAAAPQEIDRWLTSNQIDPHVASIVGAPFAALSKDLGVAMNLIREQLHHLERERERHALHRQHEVDDLMRLRADIAHLAQQATELEERLDMIRVA
jgi:GTP-binding protein EngB required for normal cell division